MQHKSLNVCFHVVFGWVQSAEIDDLVLPTKTKRGYVEVKKKNIKECKDGLVMFRGPNCSVSFWKRSQFGLKCKAYNYIFNLRFCMHFYVQPLEVS